ncbi:odorant receptor 7a-like [Cylas formicarius]|uniref:odorant receptor 7a-like n=1 Tax=Cylas formicarius TaxID=197179 RepID=UPI0029585DB4|nr:odorant receptor 7a-like [Cylas formicarius]
MSLLTDMFYYARKTMTLAGLWRLEQEHFSGLQKKIYAVYAVLIQTSELSMPVLLAANLPNIFNFDILAGFETMSDALMASIVYMKIIFFRSEKVSKFLSAAVECQRRILTESNPTLIKRYEEHVKSCNNMSKFYITCEVMSGLILFERGIVGVYIFNEKQSTTNETLGKPLPFHFWYPWDQKFNNAYFRWIFLHQYVDLVAALILVASVQIFTTTMLIYVKARLQLLQHQFRKFHNYFCYFETHCTETTKLITLRFLCKEHQNLIECINDVNDILSSAIFVEYSISSIMFGSCVFLVLMKYNVLFNIEFAVSTILFLLIVAWHAEDIVIESTRLAQALFESKWFEQSPQMQKVIHIMIMRSKRSLKISIGPFGPMTINAAMSRVRLAYSYSTVMAGM